MKCFNHHDRDAFGICRVCGKGLCLECLKETEFGHIICKNNDNCENIDNISTHYVKNFKKNRVLWAILSVIIAICVILILL